MSVRRVMGTETEYAITAATGHYNPVALSYDVVAAAQQSPHVRWDYGDENPVQDARGFSLNRAAAPSSMLTDEPQPLVTNTVVSNGARIYVDHAHPEYAAPEMLDPITALAYDRAGDALMLQAAQRANADRPQHAPIVLYKNNVDGKGASWGTHENYMVRRSVPFDTIAALMTAHFISRQIYTGAGRTGIGIHNEQAGYQLSQRADYILSEIGLQTTMDRPIINTRDESHATDDYRRLHVIVGDANRMDVPQVVKLGTTSLLLWLLESAYENHTGIQGLLDAVVPADPVTAIHTVSHDLTFNEPIALAAGGTTTAWNIQVTLMRAVYETGAAIYGTDTTGEPVWPDQQTVTVLALWKQVLLDVATVRHTDQHEWMTLQTEASRLEWLMKWRLLEGMRRRLYPHDTLEEACTDPRLQSVDLMWASLDPRVSLADRMRSQTERLTTHDEVRYAQHNPPQDTRAWLRGTLLQRFGDQIVGVNWSSITVRTPNTTNSDADGLAVLDMHDPTDFTKFRVEGMLSDAHSAYDAVRALHK